MTQTLRRLLLQPIFWLGANALVLYVWLASNPGFFAKTYVDTITYLTIFDRGSLGASLSHIRTLGYPVFIQLAKLGSGDLDRVVHAQTLVYLAAVVFFGWAAGKYLGSAWRGLVVAAPLFYTQLFAEFLTALLTETLAAGLAIATAGFLLWLAAEPQKRLAWAGLAALLFSTYQVRPALLFLLALVPLLGVLLFVLRHGWPGWRPLLRSPFAGLVAVALLPFLGWSTLRWAAVGHFGLVSFGGTNLIGITANMLSSEVIRELPPERHDLASTMLRRRRELGLPTDGAYSFRLWFRDYNHNVFKAGLKGARTLFKESDREERYQVWINREFSALSRALIRARPTLYARWVWDGMVYSLRGIAREPPIKLPGLLVLATLPFWVVAWWARRRRGRPPATPPRPPLWSGSLGLASIALGYALAGMLVIVLVEDPVARYRWSAQLFLPSALMLLLADLWASILLGRKISPLR